MNISPQDFQDEWKGLEPEQPKGPRSGFWLALAAAAFLALGVCAISAFLWQQGALAQLGAPNAETPTPEGQPTSGAIGTLPTAEPGATAPPDLAATVTVPAGVLPPTAEASAAVVVPRVVSPPTLDGDAAEWAAVPGVPSAFTVYTAEDWDGTDDMGATWQLQWDDQFLYVLVTVIDDIHVQTQTGNMIFQGDSVDMQFDTQRDADYGPSFSPDDFQITFSPGDFQSLPASFWRFQGTADGKMLDATTPSSTSVVATPNGGGYILEMAIPWADLSVAPSSGLVMGLALNASDNDRPGQAVQEMMKSNTPTRRFSDPTTWGTLTLQ